MKYIFPFIFLLLLVACSKDQRTNRRIDGTWHALVFMGENPADYDEECILTFNSGEKGEGTGTLEWRTDNFSDVYGVRYFIKNDNLCLVIDGETETFTIGELTRKHISLTDTDGLSTILEKH